MPILMTVTVPGLDAATYDQIIDHVGPNLRSAPGFRMHSAYAGDDRFTVVETWESEADWREFYVANVKDHLPPDVDPSIVELHNVLAP